MAIAIQNYLTGKVFDKTKFEDIVRNHVDSIDEKATVCPRLRCSCFDCICLHQNGSQGSNYTALMIASQQGNYNAVDILLKYGGDIASVDNVSF